MRTWKEVIESIDPNDTTWIKNPNVFPADISEFAAMFDIPDWDWCEEFGNRMLKHWVYSWICTDTRVGLAVYCLDKTPVAISRQNCRKCDENITFISLEAQEMVRKVVVSYTKKEYSFILDMGEDISGYISDVKRLHKKGSS